MSFNGLSEGNGFQHHPYDNMLCNVVSYIQLTVRRVVWRDSRLRRQKANSDTETLGYTFPRARILISRHQRLFI